jgi:hypothetical protein
MRALALLLLVFCPLSALADEASPPARWSLGAGVSTVVYSSCSDLGAGLVCPIRGASASASLERRLADASWLVLGLNGALSDARHDPLPGGSGSTRSRTQQLTVDLGLRRVLASPGALVDVSILGLVEAGYGSSRLDVGGASEEDQGSSVWIAGATVGLALDRALSPGLGLRVATPLAGAWWQQTRQELSGAVVRGRSINAAVYLAPRLELRLAF